MQGQEYDYDAHKARHQAEALRSARDLLAMSYSVGALTHPMDMLRFLDERARSIEAQATPAAVSS